MMRGYEIHRSGGNFEHVETFLTDLWGVKTVELYEQTKKMPSGPFIFFLATRVPTILTRYLETKFSMSPHMVAFYIQHMSCPSCVSSVDG